MTEIDFDASPHMLTDEDYLVWLGRHYRAVTRVRHHWVGLSRMIFTFAILRGRMDDRSGHEDRWCYATDLDAVVALALWLTRDCQGEPEGWIRHPGSGRRRPGGDATKEHIQP
jgi:hypothetical protein